jgi:stearoyl-CoA desaturase (Delta-9 desaturase)
MGFIIVGFFLLHWYGSLFFQTFFHHRYAAHGMFKMNRFWEKAFHILSYIFQGSSYLSPYAYGVMHRMHHAYADTKEDPHSPKFQTNIFKMMWQTKDIYLAIDRQKKIVAKRFTEGVPNWKNFDKFCQSKISRLAWVFMYISVYIFLAKDNWGWYFLLPIHILMSPVHGAIINWFSHKIGYRNFSMKNTSTNLFPIELLMWGEGLHNNHHRNSSNPNFAFKWFEFDPLYPFILLMNKLKIISLVKQNVN